MPSAYSPAAVELPKLPEGRLELKYLQSLVHAHVTAVRRNIDDFVDEAAYLKMAVEYAKAGKQSPPYRVPPPTVIPGLPTEVARYGVATEQHQAAMNAAADAYDVMQTAGIYGPPDDSTRQALNKMADRNGLPGFSQQSFRVKRLLTLLATWETFIKNKKIMLEPAEDLARRLREKLDGLDANERHMRSENLDAEQTNENQPDSKDTEAKKVSPWRFEAGRCFYGKIEIVIFGKPYQVLKAAVDNNGRITLAALIERIWGGNESAFIENGSVRNHVFKVRKALQTALKLSHDPFPNVDRGTNCSWALQIDGPVTKSTIKQIRKKRKKHRRVTRTKR